ncbi:Hypothetical protein KVN_LOCUS461 [uncultured virus]|nr:Hypothetical protein KVN_LOCUS461 [uncultured virus]
MDASFDNLDLYSLKICDPELDEKNKIYISKINYFSNGKINDFVFNTPNMKLISIKYYNEYYFVAELEFILNCMEFYDFFYSIDIFIRDIILLNGEEWFGAKLNFDTLDNLFKKTVKIPKKLNSLPTIEIFIPTKFGSNFISDCLIVNKNNEKISLEDLIENSEISLRLNLKNINFYASKYNLNYVCEKIVLNNYEYDKNNEHLLDSCSESSGSFSDSDYISKFH